MNVQAEIISTVALTLGLSMELEGLRHIQSTMYSSSTALEWQGSAASRSIQSSLAHLGEERVQAVDLLALLHEGIVLHAHNQVSRETGDCLVRILQEGHGAMHAGDQEARDCN